MSEPRRRRRGSSRPAGPPAAAAPAAAPVDQPPAPMKPAGRSPKSGGGAAARDAERGWRDLAGNSPSQVGLSAAMRARDIARPTEEQLAAAERNVVVVRRQWQPPT